MDDRPKHPVLILEWDEEFPEPDEGEYYLEYVIKKTGNSAELWTVRCHFDNREIGSTEFYWDRIPTKEEKRLEEDLHNCLYAEP